MYTWGDKASGSLGGSSMGIRQGGGLARKQAEKDEVTCWSRGAG